MSEERISEIISLASERDTLKVLVGNMAYGMYLAGRANVPDMTVPIPESVISKKEVIARCKGRIDEIDMILEELNSTLGGRA